MSGINNTKSVQPTHEDSSSDESNGSRCSNKNLRKHNSRVSREKEQSDSKKAKAVKGASDKTGEHPVRQFLRGLKDFREMHKESSDTHIKEEITTYLVRAFKKLKESGLEPNQDVTLKLSGSQVNASSNADYKNPIFWAGHLTKLVREKLDREKLDARVEKPPATNLSAHQQTPVPGPLDKPKRASASPDDKPATNEKKPSGHTTGTNEKKPSGHNASASAKTGVQKSTPKPVPDDTEIPIFRWFAGKGGNKLVHLSRYIGDTIKDMCQNEECGKFLSDRIVEDAKEEDYVIAWKILLGDYDPQTLYDEFMAETVAILVAEKEAEKEARNFANLLEEKAKAAKAKKAKKAKEGITDPSSSPVPSSSHDPSSSSSPVPSSSSVNLQLADKGKEVAVEGSGSWSESESEHEDGTH